VLTLEKSDPMEHPSGHVGHVENPYGAYCGGDFGECWSCGRRKRDAFIAVCNVWHDE
jgi:hypothetical protein